MSEEYIPAKKTQIMIFKSTPLYYFSKDNEPLLYKKEECALDPDRIKAGQFPELFIKQSDREQASAELYQTLNYEFAQSIFSKGLVSTKTMLCNIVEEALTGSLNVSLEMLPETLEIMFRGYSENHTFLESLTQLSAHSSRMVEHTVNILSLTMQYCFFHEFDETRIKQYGVSAVLHDVGCMEVSKDIVESEKRLTNSQFKEFQSHTTRGYKLIKTSVNYEKEIPLVALEHHEKLDGSGYPRGSKKISEMSQLIGLIDSYEPLTYRSTDVRPAQKPFDSLQILKKEVLERKYDKELFINFCSCLTR